MDRAKYRIKNSTFEGVPVWVLWVFLVPKVYFGVRTMCKKFHKVGSLRCDLARVTVLRFSLSPCNAVTTVKSGLDYGILILGNIFPNFPEYFS